MGTFQQLLGVIPRYALLLRSQYWRQEQIRLYQKARLAQVLKASNTIPFYRVRFGSAASLVDFQDLPILKRRDVPELNRSVRGVDERDLIVDWSSGSTAMPVEFIFDEAHQRGRFAARARYLAEHGWNPFSRTAWLVKLNFLSDGSQDSALVRHALFRMGNSLPNIDEFDQQFRFLLRYQPAFIYAFPSYLEGLLPLFEESRIGLKHLRQIFTGAEVLDDILRQRIRAITRVPVAENYGSTEAFVAWECRDGRFHINAEHVLVELIKDDGVPAASGEIGRVIVTTLENLRMPLIRYEIGDYALAVPPARCPCGRTLPLLGRILGRGMNLFRGTDGGLMSPWPLVEPLKARRELKQFQLVQTAADRFVVRFVAATPLGLEGRTYLENVFHRILDSPVSIAFHEVKEIPRSRAGKYMVALSEVPGAEA